MKLQKMAFLNAHSVLLLLLMLYLLFLVSYFKVSNNVFGFYSAPSSNSFQNHCSLPTSLCSLIFSFNLKLSKSYSCCLNILGCVMFCYRVADLTGMTIFKKIISAFPAAHLIMGISVPNSLLCIEIWFGLGLCKSCARFAKCYEVISEASLLCPKDSFIEVTHSLWLLNSLDSLTHVLGWRYQESALYNFIHG